MATTSDQPEKILVIWPPQVLSYFNAGHHLALYQVAGHLRATYPGAHVTAIDASVERLTWKDIGNKLFREQYDVIAVMNEFDGIDGFRRFVAYAKALIPTTSIVTFGRLSGVNPHYFERFDIDAIVENGDFEAGVTAAITAFADRTTEAAGVHLRRNGAWVAPARRGDLLPAEDWYLPTPSEIPHALYDVLYLDDANKFCGIPRRRELVVPAARGCPIGCSYCEVPLIFTKQERRLTVERTIRYIEESFDAAPFEYVAFYAPTFTLDKKWMDELCRELISRGSPYPWKCATTIHHLSEDLIRKMGAAGCIRISVGLETLDPEGSSSLPRAKQKSTMDLDRLSAWCAESGIELNCFVIVGLPGTTIEGVEATIEAVRERGGRARPTVYAPWEDARSDLLDHEMAAFNRQLFVPDTHTLTDDELARAYDIIFGRQPDVTQVFENIPAHPVGLARRPA
ncbi:radical SAM protein [Amycolatopsis rhabdoformis]|uniref:Radical SAM protein n=1 Tax=Amycolatopsis rhabdoformis TaxID=1448059 RepID=A0ABZ1HZT1_9PSEU|nr:radical SAM protein [Amycolatopsis rhabdoformis]WSE27369.1 radical SAM protein [Amycolatopsis rhabdoformis]